MKENIFLPGSENQIKFLLNNITVEDMEVLIIGPGTAPIADHLTKMNNKVQIIVEDYDSMIETRLELSDKSTLVRIMDFENTDFDSDKFDLVYAQASVSSLKRNKIIKEIKRILKKDAYLCVGEIVKLNSNVPKFVTDIWDRAELLPLAVDDLERYYAERKFEITAAEDFSNTLKKYYQLISDKLKEIKTGEESGSERRLLNLYSHERNAYLKLGGDKFMGFKSLILIKR